MTEWEAIRQPDRITVLGRLWPEIEWSRVVWIEHGWDFLVGILDERVFRLPRTHAAVWRQRREMALLARLDSAPVLVPKYTWWAPGLAGYQKISGTALDSKHPPSEAVARELAHFMGWLHHQSVVDPPLGARQHWITRMTGSMKHLMRQVGPLLSVKESRRLSDRFEHLGTSLTKDDWRLVLCHGDLVAEHVLLEPDQRMGIIDFGDWRLADGALDWSGVVGMEAWAESEDPGCSNRIAGYQLWASALRVNHAVKMGNVERGTHGIRVLRRQL